MKSSIAIAAAGILGVASAGHHDHALFHKRHDNATEQCSTVWSTWYGEATMVPLPAPTTTTTTTTHVPEPTKVAKPVQALQITKIAPAGGQDFLGAPVGSSGMGGITYSTYQGTSKSASSCKEPGQIASDIAAIHAKGFNRIRLYATDCYQLSAAVPAAKANGMHVTLGIFVSNPGSADAEFAKQLQEIKDYISANGQGTIDSLLVGNEPFFGNKASVGQIASYLQQAKAAFPNLMVSCPMTHGELIQSAGSLCSLMDMVAAQIHPFFATSYVAPGLSGAYVESQMEMMSALCGNKPAFVSECGYPSGGGSFAAQLAGIDVQGAAIKSIRESSKANHITMFSSSDDDWKLGDGVPQYEAKFNCLGLF